MGLIQAVAGSIGGVLADQWKDFYTVPAGLPATAALFAAVPTGTNAGRGANTKASSNIITNGSKIIVSYSEDVCHWHSMDISGWGGFEGVSILKILFIEVSKSW